MVAVVVAYVEYAWELRGGTGWPRRHREGLALTCEVTIPRMMVTVSRVFPWRDALVNVKADTLLRWHITMTS